MESVDKGVICKWDPYNGVIVSEFTGKIAYEFRARSIIHG
jgi:DNA-directed RNA polymerase subunit beta'